MIEIGDVVPDLALQVFGSDGVTLMDGGAVTMVITLPDGVTTVTPLVNHPSVGNYNVLYTATTVGLHSYNWTVTGANAGDFNDSFYVETTVGIVSLLAAKNYMKITRGNDDELIRDCILAASDLAESPEGTGITYRRTVVANEVHTGGDDWIRVFRTPIQSIQACSADGLAIDVTTLDISPTAGLVYFMNGFNYQGRRSNVLISYTAGATSIPPRIRDAVLDLTRHLYAIHRGGTNLPRQDDPDYTPGYLLPNRIALAFQSASNSGLG